MEVAGWDGRPLAGRAFAEANALSGDLFWTPVTWKTGGDLGHPDGTSVILRFRMHNATVFGLEFE